MMSSEGSSEGRITDLLTKALSPVHLEVVDTSGGCGAMYSIKVESEMFKVGSCPRVCSYSSLIHPC